MSQESKLLSRTANYCLRTPITVLGQQKLSWDINLLYFNDDFLFRKVPRLTNYTIF